MFGVPLREPPRLAFVDQRQAGSLDRPPEPGTTTASSTAAALAADRFDVMVSVPFADGGWLNAQTRIRAEPVPLPGRSLISAGDHGARHPRHRRPDRAPRDAPARARSPTSAEAFGRGAPSTTLPETGPDEVRRLTAAFNRMQERLARFIADRTRMLAAIGHDLRTPITSLKLRTELLDDEEARTKMMATLDEMQRMTEATLAFAREDAAPSRPAPSTSPRWSRASSTTLPRWART